MEQICSFLKTFFRIKWTAVTLVICIFPFIIILSIIHIIFIATADNDGAILSPTPRCSNIGADMMKDGGTAVDAAIAAMICEGVVTPHKIGFGGGFSGILYMKRKIETIIATPIVPKNLTTIEDQAPERLTEAQAAGVPGELLGYWEMHRKYGLLPWQKLFEPSIQLCIDGFIRTDQMSSELKEYAGFHQPHQYLHVHNFLHQNSNNIDSMKIQMPIYAQTLRRIADHGVQLFYNGDMGESMIEEMNRLGKGIMTMNDLRNYHVRWSDLPITFSITNKLKAYTTPLPTTGAIIALAINIVKAYKRKDSPIFWHWVAEATRHALGLGNALSDTEDEPHEEVALFIQNLYENMIDLDFARSIRNRISANKLMNSSFHYQAAFRPMLKEGTVSINVIAPNGDAVAITSSLLFPKQSYFLSESTGIFMNNQLLSFGSLPKFAHLPKAPGSEMRPGKRLQAPGSPVIVLDKTFNDVFFIVSASGGKYIPSQVITALIKYCMLHYSAFHSINTGFMQPYYLLRNYIEYENNVSIDVRKFLKTIGHILVLLRGKFEYCITSCIGFSHLRPDPQISQGVHGNAAIVKAKPRVDILFLIGVVIICLGVLFIMVFDFIFSQNLHS